MSPEGLIRLVENPGAGTSSSLKLAGFSEHIKPPLSREGHFKWVLGEAHDLCDCTV